MPENRILVIRGGAIGDFILTLPVLAALRGRFPDTVVDVLGYPHIAQLAVAGGLADAAHPIEARALAGFFARDGVLDEGLQEYFSRFAIIVSYLYDPDGIFQANVARCTRAQFIAGPHRPLRQAQGGPGEIEGSHATETLLRPLERLAIFEADPIPRLSLPGTFTARSRLAMHPGSGSERKNWPEARWAELLASLDAEMAESLLLVGGEAEGDRLPRLAQALPPGRVELLMAQPLVEVARRLRECRVFVGHDSGMTHLAAALGVPTLALWGPTLAAVWAPRGEAVSVLQGSGGLEALSAGEVLSALRGMPPCPNLLQFRPAPARRTPR